MKILFLSDDFPPQSFGGAGKVAESLARGMVRAGHEVAVICRVGTPEQAGSIQRDGLTIHSIYSSYHVRWRYYLSLYNPQTVTKVDALMAAFKPDVVHAHNVHYHLSYACLARARKYTNRVFLTAHDVMLFHYDKLSEVYRSTSSAGVAEIRYKPLLKSQVMRFRLRYNPFRSFFIKRYLRSVKTIFAVSEALRHALLAHGVRNVVTIHNGIDVAGWKEIPNDTNVFIERFHVQGRKVMLFAGRISPLKGGEVMLQSLQEISKRIPQVALVIAGQRDAYANVLLARARAMGLEQYIRITDWLAGPDLVAAYHSASVIVVPSQYLDPFPTVNLEAMACAKPVVCTNLGGSSEAVIDGETGFVVNAFDSQAIARGVSEVLLHDARAHALGARGYDRTRKVFSIERQVAQVLKQYNAH